MKIKLNLDWFVNIILSNNFFALCLTMQFETVLFRVFTLNGPLFHAVARIRNNSSNDLINRKQTFKGTMP